MLLGPNSRTVTSIVFLIVASPIYPLLDHRGSSLSRGAQTSLYQDTSSSSTKASPGQPNDIITWSCPGSSLVFYLPVGHAWRQEQLSSVFTTTVCYMFCCMEPPVTCTLTCEQEPKVLKLLHLSALPWMEQGTLSSGRNHGLELWGADSFPSCFTRLQTSVLKVPVQMNQEPRHHLWQAVMKPKGSWTRTPSGPGCFKFHEVRIMAYLLYSCTY